MFSLQFAPPRASTLFPYTTLFRSPSIADMPVDDRDAPRTAADRAWSEFNHNVAGLFVLAMGLLDRKSTRLNSSHGYISYAVLCLKKKRAYDDGPSPPLSGARLPPR